MLISSKVEFHASPRKVDYTNQSTSMTQLIPSRSPCRPPDPPRILYTGICATKNGPYVVWKRLINAPPSSTNYECEYTVERQGGPAYSRFHTKASRVHLPQHMLAAQHDAR